LHELCKRDKETLHPRGDFLADTIVYRNHTWLLFVKLLFLYPHTFILGFKLDVVILRFEIDPVIFRLKLDLPGFWFGLNMCSAPAAHRWMWIALVSTQTTRSRDTTALPSRSRHLALGSRV
jgi:hypothetical protein